MDMNCKPTCIHLVYHLVFFYFCLTPTLNERLWTRLKPNNQSGPETSFFFQPLLLVPLKKFS